jgi:hypothetical protein
MTSDGISLEFEEVQALINVARAAEARFSNVQFSARTDEQQIIETLKLLQEINLSNNKV